MQVSIFFVNVFMMMRVAIALLLSPFCEANADGMDMVQFAVTGRMSEACLTMMLQGELRNMPATNQTIKHGITLLFESVLKHFEEIPTIPCAVDWW